MTEIAFEPERPWDDCGEGDDIDPDKESPRLRACHQRLWSHRPLRGVDDGHTLVLEPSPPGLIDVGLGRTFFGLDEPLYLTSDRVMATWWDWTHQRTQQLLSEGDLRARVLAANPVLDQIGGMMMWPGRMIDGQTMNQARGHGERARIADRMDLTLECIRLAFAGTRDYDVNPLGPTLERYWEFFELFGGFRGYVDFWLLGDLVDEEDGHVLNWMHPTVAAWDFVTGDPLPSTSDEYDTYLRHALAFVARRNQRMEAHWNAMPESADGSAP